MGVHDILPIVQYQNWDIIDIECVEILIEEDIIQSIEDINKTEDVKIYRDWEALGRALVEKDYGLTGRITKYIYYEAYGRDAVFEDAEVYRVLDSGDILIYW